ncbi:MAG: GAF domain-containing protein, partial [Pricia sp.]
MKAAKDHKQERERLESLETYSVMDSLPEADYDNLTRLAAHICGTPISLITLLDDKRQWFKSNHGLKVRETPKEHAFCAHAVNEKEGLFVIEDARKDERFHDNPLVTSDPNVIFYAGVPLMTREGLPLGTLCVIDHEPKILDKAQVDALNVLSEQIMRLLELRKSKLELVRVNQELESRNAELESFVDNVAHDLKSPLGNIWTFTDVLQKGHSEMLDEKGRKILGMIKMSSEKLGRLIDGLLEHAISIGRDME